MSYAASFSSCTATLLQKMQLSKKKPNQKKKYFYNQPSTLAKSILTHRTACNLAHMQPKPSGKKREAKKQLAEKPATATSRNARTTSDSLHVANCLSFVGGRGRMYLDLERNRCTGDMSPPSDNVIFDNQCYATTPSSSNGNSDMEQPQQQQQHCQSRRCNGSGQTAGQYQQQQQQQQQQQRDMHSVSTPGSPTSRLLLEYEMHLRNTLAKGMDAESYSLHTFEALLSQSMENLGGPTYVLSYSLYRWKGPILY